MYQEKEVLRDPRATITLGYHEFMTRVAITGGAGFIGSNLAKRLSELNYEIVVVDDLSTGMRSNLNGVECDFYEESIVNKNEIMRILEPCETIFHLAARGSVPRSIKNPIATHVVNATGTLNILEIARETGAHVVFSSSSSVYGKNLELPKKENMWLSPLTPYAASKLSAESYVQAYGYTYNVPVTLFRLFNVFGPGQRPDHEYAAVLPKWIWLSMQGHPIDVYGDGSTSRDFTYIETVLDVLISSCKNRIIPEGPVNLAFGERITLLEVIAQLGAVFPELKVNFTEPRVGDVKDSQNSPELIKELFPDITPKPFDQALIETIEWFKIFGKSIVNGPRAVD